MGNRTSIKAIPLTSIDSSTFTGAYQVINTNGLPNNCTILKIINNSNKDVTVSYDGSTDNDYVQTMTVALLESQTNAQPTSISASFPLGTKVYVKQAAAGTGLVYLAGYYTPQGV